MEYLEESTRQTLSFLFNPNVNYMQLEKYNKKHGYPCLYNNKKFITICLDHEISFDWSIDSEICQKGEFKKDFYLLVNCKNKTSEFKEKEIYKLYIKNQKNLKQRYIYYKAMFLEEAEIIPPNFQRLYQYKFQLFFNDNKNQFFGKYFVGKK